MFNRKHIKKALAAYDASPMSESTAWTREMNREWRYVAMENALRAYGVPQWNEMNGREPLPPTGVSIFIYREKSDTIGMALSHPDLMQNPDITHWMLNRAPIRPKTMPANYIARRNPHK